VKSLIGRAGLGGNRPPGPSTNGPPLCVGTSTPQNNFVVDSTGATTEQINGTGANATLKLTKSGTLKWEMLFNSASSDRLQIDNGTNGVLMNSGDTLWSSLSDARLKTNVQTLSVLDRLQNFRAVSFNWKDPSLATTTQLGVIAQELYPIFPEAVTKGSDNPNEFLTPMSPDAWTVKYDVLAPLALEGVKELNAKVDSLATTTAGEYQSFASSFFSDLFARLTQWFADAANGIHDLYATIIHAHEVHANELCATKSDGTEVCVTGDQLAAVLAGQGSGSPSGGISNEPQSNSSPQAAGTASTTPPILSVNGNNPATVPVGDTYADLGATITGPVGDINLGISATVDGGATTTLSALFVDTSLAGTHTIVYSATDQNGLTGTASRTVNVIDPTVSTSSPQELASSTPPTSDASSTPSISEASSTPALSDTGSTDATSTTP